MIEAPVTQIQSAVTAAVIESSISAAVTITAPSLSVTVDNGRKGDTGADGLPGADGHSPVLTWSGVGCWFTSAPRGDQAGPYISASVELVDAAQALQVALRQREKAKSAEDRPALGTFTLGGCTLTLLRPPVTYQDVPQMQLTAAGTSYLTGPLTATKVYALEGETNASGWSALQSWFESTIGTTPAAGAYFPLGAPTATAANDVVNGLKVITYTVTLSVGVAQ